MAATPLRQWLTLNNESIMGLARTLHVTRGAVQFWVRGDTMPRGQMLEKLTTLTGLSVRELIPDPHKQELKRLKEEARRLEERRNGFRIKRRAGRPKKAWVVLKGKGKPVKKRGARGKRTARR
jgi:transcriptional regulator with XRE-family HTH domain